MHDSSLNAVGDMRKSAISGRNPVISGKLGEMRQMRKWGEVPAKPVVKAGTLEREDLARPSYGSGRDVEFCGQVGDKSLGIYCFVCLWSDRAVLWVRGCQRGCSISY